MQKRLLILGSTGSIGRAALDVAAALPDAVRVVGLVAGRNARLLGEQASRFQVSAVGIHEETFAEDLRHRCPSSTRVYAGASGLLDLMGATDANLVLAAIVGSAGLAPTLAAVERGIDIALANKETLVMAGALLMPLARQRGVNVIPVDSEHSAVFQALQAGERGEVHRVYLTASGGPFRTWTREQIASATLEDALRHPTWTMGPKITIDSATLMNKGLEVVEAAHLFGLPADQIEVLVHPESIVHSMVEYRDGSIIAQLGTPDMRTPIQYALTHPRRLEATAPRLMWSTVRSLTFEPPDFERFPALGLAYDAARRAGSWGAVLNAANEAAVDLFRSARIGFVRIPELIGRVLARHRALPSPSLDDLLACDAWARQEVYECSR